MVCLTLLELMCTVRERFLLLTDGSFAVQELKPDHYALMKQALCKLVTGTVVKQTHCEVPNETESSDAFNLFCYFSLLNYVLLKEREVVSVRV